jgi:hypothetical protein
MSENINTENDDALIVAKREFVSSIISSQNSAFPALSGSVNDRLLLIQTFEKWSQDETWDRVDQKSAALAAALEIAALQRNLNLARSTSEQINDLSTSFLNVFQQYAGGGQGL